MDSVINRIRKALTLAKDNSNENESQTAILLAQRLMAKHGLTTSDVSVDDQREDKKVDQQTVNLSRIEWWQKKLASVIDDNFRTYSYFRRGTHLGFLGLEEDVLIACEVFKFANESIKHHVSNYLKTTYYKGRSRAEGNRIKNDYINGYLNGLKEKFQAQIQEDSFALVLVKDEIVEDAFNNANWKVFRPHIWHSAGNLEAYEKGLEDGKNMNDHDTMQLGG